MLRIFRTVHHSYLADDRNIVKLKVVVVIIFSLSLTIYLTVKLNYIKLYNLTIYYIYIYIYIYILHIYLYVINHTSCAQVFELPWGHWRIGSNQEDTLSVVLTTCTYT